MITVEGAQFPQNFIHELKKASVKYILGPIYLHLEAIVQASKYSEAHIPLALECVWNSWSVSTHLTIISYNITNLDIFQGSCNTVTGDGWLYV